LKDSTVNPAFFMAPSARVAPFSACEPGACYLVFPLISLYPVLTVLLSLTILREHAGGHAIIGIALATPAMVLLSWRTCGERRDSGPAVAGIGVCDFLYRTTPGALLTAGMTAASAAVYVMVE
jgi:drug/metabolite transporter (DMT)-like permease